MKLNDSAVNFVTNNSIFYNLTYNGANQLKILTNAIEQDVRFTYSSVNMKYQCLEKLQF